ncbi:MAG TPA: hypothetical protein VGM10_27110 [Actinocrinis sp.]|jgi:hypothetical protein
MTLTRTSFAGALVAIALGGILAFAIQTTAKDINVQKAGLIIIVAGVADLAIRFAIASNPLLPAQTAEVASVVEPFGEPLLEAMGEPAVDAHGRVITVTPAIIPPTHAPAFVVPPGEDAEYIYEEDEFASPYERRGDEPTMFMPSVESVEPSAFPGDGT